MGPVEAKLYENLPTNRLTGVGAGGANGRTSGDVGTLRHVILLVH